MSEAAFYGYGHDGDGREDGEGFAEGDERDDDEHHHHQQPAHAVTAAAACEHGVHIHLDTSANAGGGGVRFLAVQSTSPQNASSVGAGPSGSPYTSALDTPIAVRRSGDRDSAGGRRSTSPSYSRSHTYVRSAVEARAQAAPGASVSSSHDMAAPPLSLGVGLGSVVSAPGSPRSLSSSGSVSSQQSRSMSVAKSVVVKPGSTEGTQAAADARAARMAALITGTSGIPLAAAGAGPSIAAGSGTLIGIDIGSEDARPSSAGRMESFETRGTGGASSSSSSLLRPAHPSPSPSSSPRFGTVRATAAGATPPHTAAAVTHQVMSYAPYPASLGPHSSGDANDAAERPPSGIVIGHETTTELLPATGADAGPSGPESPLERRGEEDDLVAAILQPISDATLRHQH